MKYNFIALINQINLNPLLSAGFFKNILLLTTCISDTTIVLDVTLKSPPQKSPEFPHIHPAECWIWWAPPDSVRRGCKFFLLLLYFVLLNCVLKDSWIVLTTHSHHNVWIKNIEINNFYMIKIFLSKKIIQAKRYRLGQSVWLVDFL